MVGDIINHNNLVIENNKINAKKEVSITFYGKGKLLVNGKELYGNTKVDEKDEIIYIPYKSSGEAKGKIKLNKDKTEATLSTFYTPSLESELNTVYKEDEIFLEENIKELDIPKSLKEEEIYRLLKESNIIFGIKTEEIKKYSKLYNLKEVPVAEGIPPINGKDDKLQIIQKISNQSTDESNLSNINYKERFTINYVKIGEVIGEIKRGIVGVDGKDVYGNSIPRKKKKILDIKASSGCRYEDNKFYATINGQPIYKGGYFTVNPLFTLENDVDIKSGNIKFSGELVILGEVKEGMEVTALGGVKISKGVYRSEVISNSDIEIKGNVIASKIKAGAVNVALQNKSQYLRSIVNDLMTLYQNINYLRQNKLVDLKKPDGEIIRGLLETKFRNVVKDANKLIELYKDEENLTIKKIEDKLIGYNILNIKSNFEIFNLAKEINMLYEENEKKNNIKSDLVICTAYESECEASGSVFIGDKGIVACNVYAGDEIIFKSEEASCRGGYLKAKNLIKAGSVGSETGGKTTLEVSKEGRIIINKCYRNTMIIVGSKRYVFEKDQKLVEAYLDIRGDLIIEKLAL